MERRIETQCCGGTTETADQPATGHTRMLAVLCALMGFGSISTDFYLPAMPEIARALGSDQGKIELTIPAFLAGFAFGQLLWGPLSDAVGRRGPIIAGLVLFAIGSAGCAMSGDVTSLIAWRVIQALGAAAGVVLARAMVRDLFEGVRAAQIMSALMAVVGIAPLLGPVLGAQIDALAGWRAIFGTLVLVGIVTIVVMSTVPETLPSESRQTGSVSAVLRRYGQLLRQRQIWAFVAPGAFFYGGMFAYIAGTPFAFITYHHVPAQYYGFLFGAAILGIIAANMLNTRLVPRWGIVRALCLGTGLAAIAGIATLFAAITNWGGLWGLFLPLALFVSANGLISANSIAGALSGYPRDAGSVSALAGALQYGSGIAGSAMVAVFADGTPAPLGWIIAASGLGALLCAMVAFGLSGKKR